jgi:hypothetical protein
VIAVVVVEDDAAGAVNDAVGTEVAAGDDGLDGDGVESGDCPMTGAPASPVMVDWPQNTGMDARVDSIPPS